MPILSNSDELVDIRELVNRTRRFDLFYKIALADAWLKKDVNAIDQAVEAYLEQIRASNDFHEDDNGKDGPADYLNSFQKLLESMKTFGYDMNAAPIPIADDGDLIGGAHRAACCYVLGIRGHVQMVGSRKTPPIGYARLCQRGLHPAVADYGVRACLKFSPKGVLADELARFLLPNPLPFPDWNRRSKQMLLKVVYLYLEGVWQCFLSCVLSGVRRENALRRKTARTRKAKGYARLAAFLKDYKKIGSYQ